MAITVELSSTPKYKNIDLTPEQQTKLKTAIETFLKDKEKDLAEEPAKEKNFTLLSSEFIANTTLEVDFAVTQYEGSGKTTVQVKSLAEPQTSVAVPETNVISGVEEFLDGQNHVGIAITVESDGKTSVLTIPDVGKVTAGGSPVYITKPIVLKLDNLRKFLNKKKVTLPPAIDGLLKDASLSCDAFYFTANSGPLLMMFQLQFTKGLIASLTGDKDIGELFDIKGAAVRVFRCSKEKFPTLESYAAELRGERTAVAVSERVALA
jgi:hypothetical protein